MILYIFNVFSNGVALTLVTNDRIMYIEKKSFQNKKQFVSHKQKRTCGLPRHCYSYVYTQEPCVLKAITTIGMIDRVLLIDDQHISLCNSLPVFLSLEHNF